ncbi:DUF3108 domain-containing protein [Trinickia diaoshuihuensis]|uniref:DUF3108 domain-containing protein n=1 Tax=Trinickia diaoshuihuensis TaxID=2292265 RepID=UPI000E25470A|nr:DUF3108 domain-containing protein [Trinickia diaoshuihuensis]
MSELSRCPPALSTVSAPRGTPRRAWRWGAALALAVALHGAGWVWFATHRDALAPETSKPPVEVALLTAQRIARGETGHRPPAARTEPARARAPRHGQAAPVLHALTPPPAATESPQGSESPGVSEPSATGPALAASAAVGEPTDAATHASAGTAKTGPRFSVPPSGDLHYNTFYNGVENAPGTIRWSSDREGYEMLVSVPLPFVGTFTYESRGRIDAFGLAPEHYIEKRGRRPEQVTTFDRADKRIGFTRTSTTLALPDGAQDRFSMVMQLASLVRGDPDTYKPGVTRSFYVADDDSGELWPIETIGDESIRTAEGFIDARHFMRLPRHDGDRRRIDVWLAPSLGWLPARIMQTEPNGSQMELVWRGPLRPPGAENATSMARTPDDSSDAAALETGPTREQP